MAVGAERRIEVVRHVFASEICYCTYTKERQSQSLGALHDSRRFHFYSAPAEISQAALLRRGLGDIVYGTNRSLAVRAFRPARQPLGARTAAATDDLRTHYYVSDVERFVERAAKTRAHHSIGLEVASSDIHGRPGPFSPDSVSHQHHFVSGQF